MTEQEIKPLRECPFCGVTPEIKQIGKYTLRIKCPNFGCAIQREQKSLRYSLDWHREKIIEHWNRRTPCNCEDSLKYKDLCK